MRDAEARFGGGGRRGMFAAGGCWLRHGVGVTAFWLEERCVPFSCALIFSDFSILDSSLEAYARRD